MEEGRFRDEVVPIEVSAGRGKTRIMDIDEHPRPEVTAGKLAALGASVAVVDIDADAAREAAGEIEASGAVARDYALDVSDADAVTAVFKEIEQECGGQRCTNPAINDRIDEGRTMDIVANFGLGLGVLGFVIAGILFTIELASDDDEPAPSTPPPSAVGLRAWSTPAGSFAGVGGPF